jgi:DHA2 family multidrug resistance protein-like MFS transporter
VVLTIAYAVRMVGNAFVFSPALSEAFSALSQSENSHGTALNNTLRQVAGAVSVTMLVVISGIPQTPVAGIRLSMWITVILIFLMLITFGHYLSISKRR